MGDPNVADGLTLRLGEANLRIRLIERLAEEAGAPYRDWLRCDVTIAVPSFSGAVAWSVMPRELAGLADDLSRLHDDFPRRGSVTFQPTEPNLTLTFAIGATGAVAGHYSVRHDPTKEDRLQGGFTIDQSYLPEMANDIRAFVRTAAPTA